MTVVPEQQESSRAWCFLSPEWVGGPGECVCSGESGPEMGYFSHTAPSVGLSLQAQGRKTGFAACASSGKGGFAPLGLQVCWGRKLKLVVWEKK